MHTIQSSGANLITEQLEIVFYQTITMMSHHSWAMILTGWPPGGIKQMLYCLKTPNNAVTSQCQSQFPSKMKANMVPCLLLSLVWMDQYNECNGMTSSMEFMTNFMEFMTINKKMEICCFKGKYKTCPLIKKKRSILTTGFVHKS